MAEEQPLWRRGFDAAEAAVGPRLAELVRSEQFQVAVGLATQARKALQARAERSMRRALHTWNLPAGSDVTRILNEIGRLQREVRALARRVDEATATATAKGVDDGRAGRTGATNGRPARKVPARR